MSKELLNEEMHEYVEGKVDVSETDEIHIEANPQYVRVVDVDD